MFKAYFLGFCKWIKILFRTIANFFIVRQTKELLIKFGTYFNVSKSLNFINWKLYFCSACVAKRLFKHYLWNIKTTLFGASCKVGLILHPKKRGIEGWMLRYFLFEGTTSSLCHNLSRLITNGTEKGKC